MSATRSETTMAKRKPHSFLKDPIPTLRRAMQVLGISQSEAARRCRRAVHQTRISRWFDEKGRPNALQFEAICRAVGLTPNDCFELAPEQVTVAEIETRQRVRDLIARLGYEEAFNRLIGLPPGNQGSQGQGIPQPPPTPSPMPKGRPGGVTSIQSPDASDPAPSKTATPKGKHKPKPR